jgi:quinol monooxygenase YgiN
MELLVATLAHTAPDKEADGMARIRLLADTTRNAPGLVTARFYHSRGHEAYYFILTTWEDRESWNKARERHNPSQLLLGAATEILTYAPDQWLMQYLWGYSRPTIAPTLAAAHIATVRPDLAGRIQHGWIESLHQLATHPTMSFAFLARGMNEKSRELRSSSPIDPALIEEAPLQQGSIFLNLLSWANEAEREEFYADPNFQAISRFLSNVGVTQILTLEPL